MKNKFFFLMILALFVSGLATSVSGCSFNPDEDESGDLSGIYESESGIYSVEFKSSTKCTWYQNDLSFEGTYKKTNKGYELKIRADGKKTNNGSSYLDTVFNAIKDGEDLIITGGVVYGERFVKK